MTCGCCSSSKKWGVLLIISIWIQLLCSLAIVTKTAFFSDKQVDEWSYVIFSACLFFGVVIGSYTILWGIQTFLKNDTVETTILKWVTTLCTTASILVFMLIYNYNKAVLQHSEVNFGFKIACFFLYNGHLFFGVVLYVDHPFQPVNEFLDVPGYNLIALLWIHFVSGVYVGLAYSYLYFGRIVYTGLLVGWTVQITVLVRLCMIISIRMQSNAFPEIKLGRVNQAYVWQTIIMHCALVLVYFYNYVMVDEIYEQIGVVTIIFVIIISLYAYLILYVDLQRDYFPEGNSVPNCENGVETAEGAV